MRTFKATLIVSTSLTALLLAGCASTDETYDHGRSVKHNTIRHAAKTGASTGAQPARKVRVARTHSTATRPVAIPAKVSVVSEPASVRIADPIAKPAIKPEAAPTPLVATPSIGPKQPAKATEATSSKTQVAPPKADTPAIALPVTIPAKVLPKIAVAEPPKVVVAPVQQPSAPVVQAKPEPVAPQASPVALPPPAPKTAQVRAPETTQAEVKAPSPKIIDTAKAPEPAPEVRAAEAKIETRPLTQARQAPPQTAPMPQAAAVPLPQAVAPSASAPAAASAPVAAPAPVRQAAVETAPAQAVPMTPKQRTSEGLTRAADYMAAGRIVNARSLLEDQAKAGDPTILKALGETYDPLHLRDAYPKLARAGDPAKAMAAYEKAVAAGAKDLDSRIDALRTMIATKP